MLALGPALCSHARELIFPFIHEVSTVADNTRLQMRKLRLQGVSKWCKVDPALNPLALGGTMRDVEHCLGAIEYRRCILRAGI